MKKPDQHGIFDITIDEGYWSCSFNNCSNKAEFKIREIYWGKINDKMTERGACRACATLWAEKDNCESCLRKIRKTENDKQD